MYKKKILVADAGEEFRRLLVEPSTPKVTLPS